MAFKKHRFVGRTNKFRIHVIATISVNPSTLLYFSVAQIEFMRLYRLPWIMSFTLRKSSCLGKFDTRIYKRGNFEEYGQKEEIRRKRKYKNIVEKVKNSNLLCCKAGILGKKKLLIIHYPHNFTEKIFTALPVPVI